MHDEEIEPLVVRRPFLRFTDHDGKPVMLDANHICGTVPSTDGTNIHLDSNVFVTVRDEPAAVIAAMDAIYGREG